MANSERANLELAQKWVDKMGYNELVSFNSTNSAGPIYHTNVMMAIGSDVAVACLESVKDDKEREHLKVNQARSLIYI